VKQVEYIVYKSVWLAAKVGFVWSHV